VTVDLVDNRTGVYHTVSGERREIVIELADEAVIEALRALTPEERLAKAAAFSRYMRRALRCQLESLHPEWSEERLQHEIRRRCLGA
jgi:hypothetical protein